MRIRIKLLLSFISIGVLCLIIGTLSIFGLTTLSASEAELYDTGIMPVYHAAKMASSLNEQHAELRDAAYSLNAPQRRDAALGKLTALEGDFEENFQALGKLIISEAGAGYYEKIRSAYYNDYAQQKLALLEGIKALDAGDVEALLDAVDTTEISQSVDELMSLIMERNDTLRKHDASTANLIMGAACVLMLVIIVYGVSLALYNAATIAKPSARLAQAARTIAMGDVNVSLTANSTDEIGQLTTAFNDMIAGIKEQATVIEALANGDYTQSIAARSENDVINRALQAMIDANNSAFHDIASASELVSAGSRQIAQGAQNLAEGSTEQAASIQEMSAAISDVHQQTVTNAHSAGRALEATQKAAEYMEQSIQDMELLTQAMRAISDDSAAIGKIIKVIDDIASNTNLLSLNASVEAARVGEHGKGFAVVAAEVRSLASKSTDAAKETAQLIAGNTRRVSEGNDILHRTDGSLRSVAEQAQITNELVSEIAKASNEQTAAIAEINIGIDQISTIVQGNSASAQESAAAAEEMSSQSILLNDIVRRFKIKDAQGIDSPQQEQSQERSIPESSSAYRGLGKY